VQSVKTKGYKDMEEGGWYKGCREAKSVQASGGAGRGAGVEGRCVCVCVCGGGGHGDAPES
jgi:hypothetical protein